MRTINAISDHLQPIEDTIRNKVISAITENKMVSDDERILLTLPIYSWIINIVEIASDQYKSSNKWTIFIEANHLLQI